MNRRFHIVDLVWLLISLITNTEALVNNNQTLMGHNSKQINHAISPSQQHTDVELFQKIALSCNPVSDKVNDHRYAETYGTYLIPYIRRKNFLGKSIKFMEIGIGCGMTYGPGASLQIWEKIFLPSDEIWGAEYNEECVKKLAETKMVTRVKYVTGDQGDEQTLKNWVKQTGGNFDIIIDDGSHKNPHIYKSFMNLFPSMAPGGLYFIEDLQCSNQHWAQGEGIHMTHILTNWINFFTSGKYLRADSFPMPPGIRFISCQFQMCVIAKCDKNEMDSTRCS